MYPRTNLFAFALAGAEAKPINRCESGHTLCKRSSGIDQTFRGSLGANKEQKAAFSFTGTSNVRAADLGGRSYRDNPDSACSHTAYSPVSFDCQENVFLPVYVRRVCVIDTSINVLRVFLFFLSSSRTLALLSLFLFRPTYMSRQLIIQTNAAV